MEIFLADSKLFPKWETTSTVTSEQKKSKLEPTTRATRVLIVCAYLLPLIYLTSGDAVNGEALSLSDEDDWVDPYDFSYDEVSQKNKHSKEWKEKEGKSQCPLELLDRCRDCADYLSKNDSDVIETTQVNERRSCPSSDFLFVHFSRSLLKLLESSKSPEVVITLSSFQIGKLQEYVNEQTLTAGEITDMLVSSMGTVAGGNEAMTYNNFGISTKQVVIGLFMLILTISIFIMIMTCDRSLFRVVVAFVLSVFFASCILSYMYLYQKAIAKRMADDAQRMEFYEACKSTHNASLITNFGSFVKNIFTNRNSERTCEKIFEDHQIDIMLEVLPIDAITHAFGSVATGLGKIFGDSLGQFMVEFFGNLPFALWIPASVFLLVSLAVILAVCLYCRRSQVIITERHKRPPEITNEETGDRIEHVRNRPLPVRETGENQENRRERNERGHRNEDRLQEVGRYDQSKDHCHGRKETDIHDKDGSRDHCSGKGKEAATCDARKRSSLPVRETGKNQETVNWRNERGCREKDSVQEIGRYDQSKGRGRNEKDLHDSDESRDHCPGITGKESVTCDARKSTRESDEIPDSNDKPIEEESIQGYKNEAVDTSRNQERLSDDEFEVLPDERELQRDSTE